MKYLCEGCERLVPPAAFRVESTRLVLECPRCHAETRTEPARDEAPASGPVILLASEDAVPEPLQQEPTRRVKLPSAMLESMGVDPSELRPTSPTLRVIPGAGSTPARPPPEDPFAAPEGHCPKCISPRAEGATVCPTCGLDYTISQPESFQPSEPLAAAWRGVWESWEDPAVHDRVLALASQRGELAALGRLYRIRLAHLPEDALAQRGRGEVLRLASAGSLLMAPPPADPSARMKTVGLVLLLLAVMGVVAMLARQLLSAAGP